MAEKNEMRKENIQKAKEILSGGNVTTLFATAKDLEGGAKKIKTALEEKLKALDEQRKKQAEQVVETEVQEVSAPVKEEKVEPVKEIKEEKPAPEINVTEKVEVKEEKVQEVKPEKEQKAEVVKQEQPKQEPARQEFVAPPRPSFIVRREGPIKPEPERKPKAEFRPQREFKQGERPERGERGERPQGFKKEGKPEFNRGGAPKKPQTSTYVAPQVIPTVNDKRSNNFAKKKQNGADRFEEKHVINKRALVRNQVDVDDFDENKSGYRKFRPVKKQKEKAEVNVIKIEKAVINTEIIPLKY